MTFEINILKEIELVGTTGANWKFNSKKEKWESILTRNYKPKRTDLIYNARPFFVMVEDPDDPEKTIQKWLYDLTVYPENTAQIREFLNEGEAVKKMTAILLNTAEAHVIGMKHDYRTKRNVSCPQLKRGSKVLIKGGYYQKAWETEDASGVDHCIQIVSVNDLEILPYVEQISPFDAPKVMAQMKQEGAF